MAVPEDDVIYWNEIVLRPPLLGNLVTESTRLGDFVNSDLLKQAPRKSKGHWEIRRFVSRENFLFYFKTSTAKAPAKGVIYLPGASLIRIGEYDGQKFAFQIKPLSPRHGKGASGNVLPIDANDGAVFTLATRTESEFNQWLVFVSRKAGPSQGSPARPRAGPPAAAGAIGAVLVGMGGTGATVDAEDHGVERGLHDLHLSGAQVAQAQQPGLPPGVPGGQILLLQPGGQTLSVVPGGQPLPPQPGGQPLSVVPVGQPLPAVSGGQPLPVVPGGQPPAPQPGGQPLPAVPGGEPLPPLPGGQEPLPPQPGGHPLPAVSGGQPLYARPGEQQALSAVHGGQPLPPQPREPSAGGEGQAGQFQTPGGDPQPNALPQPGGQPLQLAGQPQMLPPGMWAGPGPGQPPQSMSPSGSLEDQQAAVQQYPPFQPNPALPNYQPYLYPGQTIDPALLEHFAPVGEGGQPVPGPGMPVPVPGGGALVDPNARQPQMLPPGMTMNMGMPPPGMMFGVPGGMVVPPGAGLPMQPSYTMQQRPAAAAPPAAPAGLQVPMPGGPKLNPGQIVKNQSGQLMIVLNNGMLMPLAQQPRTGASAGGAGTAGAAAGRGRPLNKKELRKAAADRERQARALAKSSKQKKK